MNDGFERRDFIHGVGLLAGAVAATTLIERPALAQTVPPAGAKPMTYDMI
jgi:hypothetical protein